MNCVSYDIIPGMRVLVPLLVLFVCVFFFPGVFFRSRVTGICPETTDLIMRVNVKTTTTINITV